MREPLWKGGQHLTCRRTEITQGAEVLAAILHPVLNWPKAGVARDFKTIGCDLCHLQQTHSNQIDTSKAKEESE